MKEFYIFPTKGDIQVLKPLFDTLFKTLKTKETDTGVALFASRVNSADFTPIILDTTNAVVDRVLAANKKNWNVNILTAPTFDALLDDVKNTTTNKYYEDDAKDESIKHI